MTLIACTLAMVSLGLGVLLYREKRKGRKDDKEQVDVEFDELGGFQINGHEEEDQDREEPGSPAEYCVIQREVGTLPLVERDGVGEHSSDSDNVYNTLVRQE